MIKKILVPLDGSKLAEKALPYAEALAQKFEAELILVRVLHPMLVVADYGAMAYYSQEAFQQEQVEANLYLSNIDAELRARSFRVRSKVLDGLPVAEAIIDLARQEAVELVVMSTHGRSGLGRWVYGSVANKVLQQAPCPVFLVRANEVND
jgi:nucleotide-binding universal stress UspA family protein